MKTRQIIAVTLCWMPLVATIATGAAVDATPRSARRAYFFTFGAGCALLMIWLSVMLPNLISPENPAEPSWMLLFPLFLLLGFIPWLVAGREV